MAKRIDKNTGLKLDHYTLDTLRRATFEELNEFLMTKVLTYEDAEKLMRVVIGLLDANKLIRVHRRHHKLRQKHEKELLAQRKWYGD